MGRLFFWIFFNFFFIFVVCSYAQNSVLEFDKSDLFLTAEKTGGISGYYRSDSVLIRGGFFSQFITNEIGTDVFARVLVMPKTHVTINLSQSILFSNGIELQTMYAGAVFSSYFRAFKEVVSRYFVTVEYKSKVYFSPDSGFSRVGLEFLPLQYNENSRVNFSISPYFFAYTNQFDSYNIGLGASAKFNVFALPFLGFAGGFSTRYAFFNSSINGIYLYENDGYRGEIPQENGFFNAAAFFECYLYSSNLETKIMDFVELYKIKSGIFADTAFVNKEFVSAGAFLRVTLSVFSASPFSASMYAGWDFNAENFFGRFQIVLRW